MPTEQLNYAQIAERLGVSAEAARAIVKRHTALAQQNGKTLAAIDLEEIRHPVHAASSIVQASTVQRVKMGPS